MSVGAAKVTATGKVVQLNAKAEPDSIVTEADAQSPRLLAKLLTGILAELARLRRRYAPRHIDFEDLAIASGGKTLSLHHGFNGRVRWWLVDVEITGSSAAPIVQKWSPLTDADHLGLWTDSNHRVSIRVEETA